MRHISYVPLVSNAVFVKTENCCWLRAQTMRFFLILETLNVPLAGKPPGVRLLRVSR